MSGWFSGHEAADRTAVHKKAYGQVHFGSNKKYVLSLYHVSGMDYSFAIIRHWDAM